MNVRKNKEQPFLALYMKKNCHLVSVNNSDQRGFNRDEKLISAFCREISPILKKLI